jgi:hypothetical protein
MLAVSVKVIPVSVSKVDWAGFQQLVQSTFGYNPIQNLNENNEFTLFCETLKKLKARTQPLKHLYLTIAVTGDKKIFQSIYDFEHFKLWWEINNDEYLILVTGSFDEWKISLEKTCQKESEINTRILFNKVFLIFERGFPDAIKEWHKTGLLDGSFIIHRRM